MSYSYTFTESKTFTVTHARYIAAKVATDLKRLQRFYGYPNDREINDFETEIVEFLKNGYLGTVTYGFKKDGNWIEPTLRYTARDLSEVNSSDDDPGRIRPNANIDGAYFSSFMIYSPAWWSISHEEKNNFENILPFRRTGADEPGINGYLSNDKSYASGGKALDRSILKNY